MFWACLGDCGEGQVSDGTKRWSEYIRVTVDVFLKWFIVTGITIKFFEDVSENGCLIDNNNFPEGLASGSIYSNVQSPVP